MEGFSGDEIWRSIPPEEKFQIMAEAQAAGIVASVISVIICSTIAVGLKLSWLMWGSLIATPFIFQFAAGKKWRTVRPRVMLEYLAARSAARRFAFATRGNDLACKFLFRGRLEKIFDEGAVQEVLEAMIENTKEAEVWVALFGDSLVMMEEHIGGAEARFSQLLDDHLKVQARALDDKGEYSSKRELIFTSTSKTRSQGKFRLTSTYPAALIVFEKKLQAQLIRPNGSKVPKLEVNDSFDYGDDSDSLSSGLMVFN